MENISFSYNDISEKYAKSVYPLSPNKSKIQKLNSKVIFCQNQNLSSKDAYQVKIKSVEENIQINGQKIFQNLMNCENDLLVFHKEICQQKSYLDTNISQDVKNLEIQIINQSNREKQQTKQFQNEIQKHFQENIRAIKSSLDKKSKNIYDFNQRLKGSLNSQIACIEEQIETQIRKYQQQKLLKNISQEISIFQQELQKQCQIRERKQNQILQNLNDINQRLKSQINVFQLNQEQVKARQNYDFLLLRLLQQACNKVQICIRRKI